MWARARWPGHEILSSSYVVGSDAESVGGTGGLKLEFDGMVIGPSSELLAVIEAKTGGPLYTDIPKLLSARDRWMRPQATLDVRVGRRKADCRRSLRVGQTPPLLVYRS